MLKWIGGATAALVLVFGGATLASGMFAPEPAPRSAAPSLEQAIPVDAQALTQAPGEAASSATSPKGPARPAPDTHFTIKRILPIGGPIKYGEWHWDDADVPAGPLVVTVDLDARVMSVFQGGYEIGATAVMLGTDEHPTPLGTFPIISKERHNVSEKYGNAPMPWTLRLTRDGVAIHGGHLVENGYASHGCIGAPDDFMRKLFALAAKGDKVIITRGETMQMGDAIL